MLTDLLDPLAGIELVVLNLIVLQLQASGGPMTLALCRCLQEAALILGNPDSDCDQPWSGAMMSTDPTTSGHTFTDSQGADISSLGLTYLESAELQTALDPVCPFSANRSAFKQDIWMPELCSLLGFSAHAISALP